MLPAFAASSSSQPAEEIPATAEAVTGTTPGLSVTPILDRSGERQALEALRASLQRPPTSVEDDASSQAWLAGLQCMADYTQLCNDAAMAEGSGGLERHHAVHSNPAARVAAHLSSPIQGADRRGGRPHHQRRTTRSGRGRAWHRILRQICRPRPSASFIRSSKGAVSAWATSSGASKTWRIAYRG